MKALDLIIIFGYLIGIVLFGTWFGRKQKTTSDYFLGDRSVPWWAVAFSIVATDTSTITFISVPGIAFARGGNFQFIQLVLGYMLARVVISLLFIPSYFGGMEAVIWVEVVQLGIYLAGAAMAGVVLVMAIKGGLPQAVALGEQYHKFNFIDFGIRHTSYAFTAPFTSRTFNFSLPIDLTKTYTFWAGLLGGCFLTMSTHGTDQYLVQRYLCTDKPRRAAAA